MTMSSPPIPSGVHARVFVMEPTSYEKREAGSYHFGVSPKAGDHIILDETTPQGTGSVTVKHRGIVNEVIQAPAASGGTQFAGQVIVVVQILHTGPQAGVI